MQPNRSLFVLIALLFALAAPALAGPLDGAWYHSNGDQIIISSQITNASVTIIKKDGRRFVSAARYQGYSTLAFNFQNFGRHTISLVNNRQITLSGPGFSTAYYR